MAQDDPKKELTVENLRAAIETMPAGQPILLQGTHVVVLTPKQVAVSRERMEEYMGCELSFEEYLEAMVNPDGFRARAKRHGTDSDNNIPV